MKFRDEIAISLTTHINFADVIEESFRDPNIVLMEIGGILRVKNVH